MTPSTRPVTGLDARLFGARGDGVTDSLPAITAAIAAAVAEGGGLVLLAAGTYLVSDEIKLPSGIGLAGAGQTATTILLAEDAPAAACVVTNQGNTRVAHTAPDRDIVVRDLTLDGNCWNRPDAVVQEPSRSCLAFACVEDSRIENITVRNGLLHGIDISASVYNDATLTYAPGPSRNITIDNATAIDTRVDDGITTHHSEFVTIQNSQAIKTSAHAVLWTQQGIEVDEGSRDIVVQNCYVYGWAKGFQVKGHVTSRPATRVILRDCTVDHCSLGFDIDWQGTEPDTNGARLASDVILDNCRTRDLSQVVPGYWPELYSLFVRGYDGVTVNDLLIEDTPTGGGIYVGKAASNVSLNRIVAENSYSDLTDTVRPLLWYAADVGNFHQAHDVLTRTPINGPIVWVASGTTGQLKDLHLSYIRGSATTAAAATHAVVLAASLSGFSVDRVLASGYSGNITAAGSDGSVDTTDTAYTGPIAPAAWEALTLPTGWTGQVRYCKLGADVTVLLTAVTPPSGVTGTVNIAQLPQGCWPAFEIPLTVQRSDGSTTTGATWISASGLIRGAFTSATTTSYRAVTTFPASA